MDNANVAAATRIEIRGEFNIFTATALRQQLLDALDQPSGVDVDLSGVSEIDSAGLQLMIAAKREAALRGKSLRFAGHSREVFDILELCDVAGELGDPLLIHPAKN